MMTVFTHEMRQSLRMVAIWSIVVAGMVMLCMIIFPEMEKQAADMEEMFATMGGFTAAFGMDKVSIADALGFYGIEGGAILGLGGALFAALVGVRMLSKEEVDHTAEFLLTHPVGRASVVSGKLAAVIMQIVLFNAVCLAVGVLSFVLIDEPIEGDAFWLFHLAQLILHLEIACVCFGASAFLKRGSTGFGLGLAAFLYFLNIVANISEEAEFVRYITPFGYADAANILPEASIEIEPLVCGIAYLVIGAIVAYLVYLRKDIAT